MRIDALIVAAGRGTRVAGGALPKQYQPLAGKSMLARSLASFLEAPAIAGVLCVIHPDDRDLYEAAVGHTRGKLLPPAHGADTRQGSVLAGLEALAARAPDAVLIHDAARPFTDADLIARVAAALDRRVGAIAALPVADTLKREAAGQVSAGTVPRQGLWRAQTPQGFHFPQILAAHRKAAHEGLADFTDDAAIAEWAGLEVALVPGSERNRKITTGEDIAMAERELRLDELHRLADIRVGSGFDVHRFVPGDHVMLCGVRVPHDLALEGHSDADAPLHALTDALLGAIGAGDIGQHFPPSEARWKGADSGLFVREAVRLVVARGGLIANADVTILCERPRIGPHREAMRARLAELLGIDLERTSVKATTTERLGFTGRGEGLAAMATAMVRLPL